MFAGSDGLNITRRALARHVDDGAGRPRGGRDRERQQRRTARHLEHGPAVDRERRAVTRALHEVRARGRVGGQAQPRGSEGRAGGDRRRREPAAGSAPGARRAEEQRGTARRRAARRRQADRHRRAGRSRRRAQRQGRVGGIGPRRERGDTECDERDGDTHGPATGVMDLHELPPAESDGNRDEQTGDGPVNRRMAGDVLDVATATGTAPGVNRAGSRVARRTSTCCSTCAKSRSWNGPMPSSTVTASENASSLRIDDQGASAETLDRAPSAPSTRLARSPRSVAVGGTGSHRPFTWRSVVRDRTRARACSPSRRWRPAGTARPVIRSRRGVVNVTSTPPTASIDRRSPSKWTTATWSTGTPSEWHVTSASDCSPFENVSAYRVGTSPGASTTRSRGTSSIDTRSPTLRTSSTMSACSPLAFAGAPKWARSAAESTNARESEPTSR